MKKQFTKKENTVLTEIYRRLNYFHKGNLNEPLLLLALPSEVKAIRHFGFVTPYSNEVLRALNWYRLTPKGKAFFSNYIKKIGTKENHKLRDYKIKKFDYSLIK